MRHISALTWFRKEARALGPLESAAVSWHVWRCEGCREQWRLRRTVVTPRPRLQLGLWALASTAALAVAGLWAIPAPEELRTKGSSEFILVRLGAEATRLEEGCRPGDVLQGELVSTHSFALVVSIPESGSPQVLFPPSGGSSGAMEHGRLRMPNSWVLDSVLGRERFIAVFSDLPLDVNFVLPRLLRGDLIEHAELLERSCLKAQEPAP